MIRIIISGGGTGGHVFPAIAIADAIRQLRKDAEFLFIGANGRLEMQKVPAAGYPIEGLTISGFQRRLTWKNLSFPIKLIKSLMKARLIIKKFKPDLVIGVGGYASGPTLRMAASLKIPCLIQEQNSFPGLTNNLLAKRVQKICVAYEGMEKFFPAEKIVLTGNPIRKDLIRLTGKTEEGYNHFNLNKEKKTILVIGGSLGSRTINKAILNWIKKSKGKNDFQVLWQTGKNYYPEYRTSLASTQPKTVILPFIDRMDLAYSVADIIISRAGAIAISELCVVGKPVILIPSPNVAEDHQTKNAHALVEKKAALMVRDIEAIEKLGISLEYLLGNADLQVELSRHIREMAISDAGEKIAKIALNLLDHES